MPSVSELSSFLQRFVLYCPSSDGSFAALILLFFLLLGIFWTWELRASDYTNVYNDVYWSCHISLPFTILLSLHCQYIAKSVRCLALPFFLRYHHNLPSFCFWIYSKIVSCVSKSEWLRIVQVYISRKWIQGKRPNYDYASRSHCTQSLYIPSSLTQAIQSKHTNRANEDEQKQIKNEKPPTPFSTLCIQKCAMQCWGPKA